MSREKSKEENKYQLRFWIVAFLFMILVTGSVWQIYQINKPNIVRIENVFADVNGDGLPDLIVDGKVIFNQATSNF